MKVIITVEHPDDGYCTDMARRITGNLDHILHLKYCIHLVEAEG